METKMFNKDIPSRQRWMLLAKTCWTNWDVNREHAVRLTWLKDTDEQNGHLLDYRTCCW